MLSRFLVIAAVVLMACHSNGDTATRTYKLVPRNAAPSTPPISVSLAVPGGWNENLSDAMTPVFEVPGLPSGSLVSLTAIEVKGTPAQQLAKAIDLQDLTDGQRSELPGGRVWVQKTEGERVHARVFVPYPGGVVMGIAMLRGAGKLPEIRAAFETMTAGPPAR